MVMVHTSIQKFSADFEAQMKRKNFSTPKNYLDFLSNYQKLLEQNRIKYSEMIIRYQNGLSKLVDAAS